MIAEGEGDVTLGFVLFEVWGEAKEDLSLSEPPQCCSLFSGQPSPIIPAGLYPLSGQLFFPFQKEEVMLFLHIANDPLSQACYLSDDTKVTKVGEGTLHP